MKIINTRLLFSALIILCSFQACVTPKEYTGEYFTNPILDEGPDPFVFLHSDGYYYCMVTRGNKLTLWKSVDFTKLKNAESKDIWFPPAKGANSACIWAPEIHNINNTWYIYYSASDIKNEGDLTRGVFVLRNKSTDPFDNSWEDMGKIETVYPGIDGHVFEFKNERYFVYSPYIGHQSGIMIAKMNSPFEIQQPATLIGLPIYEWEKTGDREILEGPQFLEGPKDKLFLIYSAGACWDDNYGLSYFSADKNADLLDPLSWSRSNHQAFEQCPDSSVFGPGHNCFTVSPNGKESWIVFHAKATSSNECSGRSTRAQKFTWNEKGEPVFGKPYSTSTKLECPQPTNLENTGK